MDNTKNTRALRRVAVIAIHGVADQQPSSTAHRIGNLLLRHLPGAYTGFVETALRIGVQKVQVKDSTDAPRKGLAGLLQVNPRAKCVTQAQEEARGVDAHAEDALLRRVHHNYMREQLQAYEPLPEDTCFETVRLAGTRLSKESEVPPCDVHVYENYWADLSRASTSVGRLFAEFYLLLFFLCSLGRHCIDFAQVAYAREVRWWRALGWLHRRAEILLVLCLPVANLCLLGLGATTIPTYINSQYYQLALSLAVPILVALLTGLGLFAVRYPVFQPRVWAFSILPLAIITGMGSWILLSLFKPINPVIPLAGISWLIAAAGVLLVAAAYQKHKKGAFAAAVAGVTLTTIGLLGNPKFRHALDIHDVLDAALLMAEVWFVLLCVCWLLFSLFYFAICIVGRLAVRSVKSEEAQSEARSAVWTVHLTMILPGVLVVVANVLLWEALWLLFRGFIPDVNNYYAPVLLSRWLEGATLIDFSRSLIHLAAGPYFLGAYVGVTLVAFGFLWALLPVAATEIKVPTSEKRTADWLAACLDKAIRIATLPGLALAFVILLTPALYAATWWDPRYDKVWHELIRNHYGEAIAVLGAALLLVVMGSKLPTKAFGKTLRSVLDIALDVANWLRMYPREANPKSRISARFVSLLRHVHNWRDPDDGAAYSSIIIVAHSQGTVIATEVLRFLTTEASSGNTDPLLEGLGDTLRPVSLFTMGSPLRQIYSVRFPHHYRWAKSNRDLKDYSLTKWLNAYRSADYVGRDLWFGSGHAKRFQLGKPQLIVPQTEWCIGGGAHNHYWDETAPEVAEALDELIVERACSGPAQSLRARPASETESQATF